MRVPITFLACLLLAASSYGEVTTNENKYVKMVQQDYKRETNDPILEQIIRELQASYIYQAYASYFHRADVALPGIEKFFAAASLEEREHAQMLIDYVNKRGGHVVLENIDLKDACNAVVQYINKQKGRISTQKGHMCICGFLSQSFNADCEQKEKRDKWKNGLYAFEDALATEKFVNEQLLALHAKIKDVHLGHMLEHHFLDEQVEAIYKLGTYVTRLRSFGEKTGSYNLGEYIFDLELQKGKAGH